MKKINNYWVDENNNKWNADFYTEDQAIENSHSLIKCRNCSDCSDCSDCSCCSYCSCCSHCSDCSDFKSNPKRYTGDFIGSRNSQTTVYWNGEQTQVICGCFKGNLDEFKKAVDIRHGDNEYGKQYKKYIAIVEKIMKIEKQYE